MLSRMSSRPKSFRILFLITTNVNLITADMYTTSVFTYELLMKKYIESNLIHKGKKIKVLKFRNSITKKKGHSQLLNKPCLVKSPTEQPLKRYP